MNVDTGSFTALRDQVAAIEAEVAGLRELVAMRTALLEAIADMGFERGRESILGRPAEPWPPRPRHLQAVQGGRR